ncbi:hypothetical protein WN943_021825 [Citrus x changshan-huyou]
METKTDPARVTAASTTTTTTITKPRRVLPYSTQNLTHDYTIGKKLGQGQFGTTYLCTQKSTGLNYACKTIPKRKLLCQEDYDDVWREIQIMHHLSEHQHVVRIHDTYEDKSCVHIVMELCEGGELFDRIVKKGNYSEREAAKLMKTIVGVVECCHSLGVFHRDLKPENFLFLSVDEDAALKATDFGLSVFYKPDLYYVNDVLIKYSGRVWLAFSSRDLKPENFLFLSVDEDAALKATDFGLSVFYKPDLYYVNDVLIKYSGRVWLAFSSRDLKPENFLFLSVDEDAALKATDFGLSVFYKPDLYYVNDVLIKYSGRVWLAFSSRDLKPENFLFLSVDEDAALKATDFGLSVFYKPDLYYVNDVLIKYSGRVWLAFSSRDLKPENFLFLSVDEDAALKATDFGLSVFYKPDVLVLSKFIYYEFLGCQHAVLQGGELFDRIVKKGNYSEREAAKLMKTIVGVVECCHSLGVFHRDLKPENFLFLSVDEDAALKATDFGLSVFYKPDEVFSDVVGSPYYVAPEVLRKHYGPEADVWSAGVILYILLSGVPPFWAETEIGIFRQILEGKIDFESEPWPNISESAKDLIRKMLDQNPKRRLTAHEVLCHPWIVDDKVAPDKPLDSAVLSRLKHFSAMNKLKKMALRVRLYYLYGYLLFIAVHCDLISWSRRLISWKAYKLGYDLDQALVIAERLNEEEIGGLKELFKMIDTDNSGTITFDELKDGLKRVGSQLMESEIKDLMDAADIDNSGTIDYGEFLAATLHLNKLEREENLLSAFSFFDKDASGYITIDELQHACKEFGISELHLDDMIKEIDQDDDGQIDYEEFAAMMRKGNGGIGRRTMRNTINLGDALGLTKNGSK